MNERTRTIALLAHSFCYVATCGYRRPNGGISTHTFTGTRMAAAQLIHSGKNVHLTQSRRSQSKFDKYPAMLHKTISSKLRVKLADCHGVNKLCCNSARR